MGKLKKESGITLIALVVTIIVLLILAGVSVSMITGENGILKKAGEASEKTKIATEEEQRKMAMLEAAMNTENTTYTDPKTKQKITIPAGFAPTRIEGESTVDEGFVITDSQGNEFVWIPVTNVEEYKKNTGYNIEELSKSSVDDTEYLPDNVTNEKEAVLNIGGFYVGRFEAGAEGGNLQIDERGYENRDGEKFTWTNKPKLVCKKGATPYGWIKQEEMKKIAKIFINNSDVKSALISGTQWDVMMATINNKTDGTGKKFDVTVNDPRRHTRKYK